MAKLKNSNRAPMPPADLAAAVAAGDERKREAIRGFMAMIQRAEAGDREALKYALDAQAAVPSLRPQLNTLHDNVERSLLDAIVPDKQLYSRKAIEAQLAALRRELAGEQPSPLDALLVDRIALCWLDSMHADLVLSQRLREGCSLAQGEFYQRRADRAQRQFLRAVKTYATVRRLLAPVVQLNVAEQQINVAR